MSVKPVHRADLDADEVLTLLKSPEVRAMGTNAMIAMVIALERELELRIIEDGAPEQAAVQYIYPH